MNVLLLDTAFAAAPIYDALSSAGHDVWVMGNRPADVLARTAPSRWIDQNYAAVAAVETHVRRLGIERVVPGCTDVSIETCVRLSVASAFLDSPEVNEALSHKQKFRSLCELLDLPAPRLVPTDSFPRTGKYVCKPVDAFSGRGISIVDGARPDAVASALDLARAASRTGEALIEDYVGSDLHSCSGFIEDGELVATFFVREGSSANRFAVDTSYVVHTFPRRDAAPIIRALQRLTDHLKLKDGLIHAQFILSPSGPRLIEVSRRCPGDLYPLLVEMSSGYAYAAKYASLCAGYHVDARVTEMRRVVRHTVSSSECSTFRGVAFEQAVPARAFFPIAAPGDSLLPGQATRAGILFTEYRDDDELSNAFAEYIDRRVYRTVSRKIPI